MTEPWLRHLGRSVYPCFFPGIATDIFKGAEEYFLDLKKSAPRSVFFTHLILGLFLYFSPLVLLRSWRPLHKIPAPLRDSVMRTLKDSRFYPFRLAFFAVRGHAFISILRRREARTYFGLPA